MENTFFKEIFRANPFPQAILSVQSGCCTIVFANEAYLELTNDTEIEGKNITTIFDQMFPHIGAEEKIRLQTSLDLVISSNTAHTIPFLQLQTDEADIQEYLKITNTPMRSKDGVVKFIIQSITDVSEDLNQRADLLPAIKANEPLDVDDPSSEKQAISYLQRIIDTAQTGIFLFAPVKDDQGVLTNFRFLMANKMLASYVGEKPENIIDALGTKWFPAYKTNGLYDYYADTYLNGNTNRFDFHYDADGIDVWLDIMSTKLNDNVLVTFSDHSNLKQLQQKMEHSLSDLKRSNNSLEEFAYVASHDLQEPLRKIKSFGDMLTHRYGDTLGKEGADMINRMQSAADRMKILIEDLLTFSRISSEKTALSPVDINAVVQSVLSDLEPTIKEKNAIVTVNQLGEVLGDALQLGQVFQNLLTNALKFNKKGEVPQISITSEVLTGEEAILNMIPAHLAKKKFQLIKITDQGIGFEQQYADKIFQIFQRLHGRIDYPGTGVGLSIVKKVVQHHKGFIMAESELGKGATFSILLPIATDTTAKD